MGILEIVLPVAVSFVITVIAGKLLIPALVRLKAGQSIKEIGPTWHQGKNGTPTMGGLTFYLGVLVGVVLGYTVLALSVPSLLGGWLSGTSVSLFIGVLTAYAFGLVGFVDDYIKVVKKRNLGLTASQKLFAQLLVAAGYAISVYMAGGSQLYIPFFGLVDWGVWFIPFCMFVVVAMTNATNLTDGIDGLCGTVSFVAALFFLILAGMLEYVGQGLLAAAFAGSLAGFLVWNLHPAKVFMGDTGSLFIGGLLCALAFGVNQPFLLVPVGVVYIAENLSVMLQVGYFKLTHGKRLFKMAPLHHHFEMCGWSEARIVTVFSLVTLLGCLGAALLVIYA